MSISASLLPEFDQEMATTRTLLALVPDARAAWKPHPKSWAIGDLSLHLANLPNWGVLTMQQTEFDVNPPGGAGFTPPAFESMARTLATFDGNAARARDTLAAATDADFLVTWTLKNGGATVMALPRIAVLRSFVMSHMIHHRGQLSVYLRLNDIPLPSIYGPSADTPM